MKIYIASSWKNAPLIRYLAVGLRSAGHEVYDFTSPEHFVFNMTEESEENKSKVDWIECGKLESTQKACQNDKAGLDWADAVLLLLPCGRSAHLEAGVALGQGKMLVIYGELPIGQFEVTYNLTPHRYRMNELSKVVDVFGGKA